MTVFPLVLLLALAWPGPLHLKDDRAALMNGVQQLSRPGNPGLVTAFGDEAFVVAVTEEQEPVVVATRAGKGRLLLLSHTSFLMQEHLGVGDTRQFLRNVIEWLSIPERTKAPVVCVGMAGLVQELESLGIRATEDNRREALAGARCALVSGEHSPDLIHRLEAHVAAGGGLLLAETGWGAAGGNPLLRAPVYELAARHGVAFVLGGIASGTTLDVRTEPHRFTHAGAALRALQEGEIVPEDRDVAVANLSRALRILPDQEARFMVPLRQLLERSPDDPVAAVLAKVQADRTFAPLEPRALPWRAVGPIRGVPFRSALSPERAFGKWSPRSPTAWAESFKVGRDTFEWQEVPCTDPFSLSSGPPFPGALEEPGSESEPSIYYLSRDLLLGEPLAFGFSLRHAGALQLWCNGEPVVERQRGMLSGAPLHLELPRGTSTLLVKVEDRGAVPLFHLERGLEAAGAAAIQRAIERATDALLREQYIDGTWYILPAFGSGYTYYAAYALRKSGLPPGHRAIRTAVAHALETPATKTYSLACKILLLCEDTLQDHRSAIREGVEQLLSYQTRDGTFGYPTADHRPAGEPDLSNTLFAAMALRSAGQRGVEVPRAAWLRLVEGTLAYQAPGGKEEGRPFCYTPGGAVRLSTCVAGITVLLVSEDALGRRLPNAMARQVRVALEAGQRWLRDHYDPGNLLQTLNSVEHSFFLYGLERIAALLGDEALAGMDWYTEGARFLVDAQQPDGNWAGEVGTINALLFLRRATLTRAGESSARQRSFDAGGELALHATLGDEVQVWVMLSPQLLGKLGDVDSHLEVCYRLSRGPEATPAWEHVVPRSAPQSVALDRFAARPEVTRAGRYRLQAELREKGQPAPLARSEELELDFTGILTEEQLSYALDPARNELAQENAPALVSSGANGDRALDGQMGTYWLCDPLDEQPSWKVTLRRPARIQRIRLTHAFNRRDHVDRPRATRIEVLLDGRSVGTFEMDPDPQRKTEVHLEREAQVVELTVRILERQPAAAAVGFAAIEAFR